MKANLGLSYYEVKGSPNEIENLERYLIKLECPILNLKDNRENPWYIEISGLRKNCALEAEQKDKISPAIKKYIPPKVLRSPNTTNSTFKYESIWKKELNNICFFLKEGGGPIQFDKYDFDQVGNRKSYSFNLEFQNGINSNNIIELGT